MRHSLFSFLLMLLIAGQPVMAVADYHLLEQNQALVSNDLSSELSDVASSSFDKFSAENSINQKNVTTSSQCLDCSDCYCCAFSMLPNSDLKPQADLSRPFFVRYDSSQVEAPNTSLLRPPKI